MLLRNILLTCTLLMVGQTGSAQNTGGAIFYTLSEKNGLTDNVINCFFQDSRGVMWLGTGYGLNSYDGSAVATFHASPSGLSAEGINDIKEDNHKTLWIATAKGLSTYSLSQKTFRQFYFDSTSDVLNRYYSLALLDDDVFLASEQGLFVFNKTSKRFTRYNNADAGGNRINKILADSKKRIWLCTYNGVWLFNPRNGQFTCYNSPAGDAAFDGLVNDIIEDDKGMLWFGNWAKGLKKLDPDTRTVENFRSYANASGNTTSLAFQRNHDGSYSLWQASRVCRPLFNERRFEYLQTGTGSDARPITANRIYCDRDNMLWISTDEGVKIYNPARQYFRTTILSSFVPLTTQGIALFPLPGQLLMGGEGGSSLMQFTDSMRLVNNLSARAGTAAVMNIRRDASGNFWLCTSNGLLLLDEQLAHPRRFVQNDKIPGSLPKNFLNYSFFLKNGEAWIFPWRKGAWKADIRTGVFTRVPGKNGDTLLPAANISKAIEDDLGNIWLTDYSSGLFRYHPQTGALEVMIKDVRLSNAWLVNNHIWTATATHIFAIDEYSGRIRSWPMPEGKNKYEYDCVPDGRGYLWVATKTGLLAFSMQTGQFKSFTEGDGLYRNNMEVSMTQLSNGNIIMAGGTYVTVFDPGMVNQPIPPSPLLFTGLVVDGKEKITGNGTVHLRWNERNIGFNWALLNYANAAGNTYYYRLDGINANWQTAGNHGQVSFNSLAPGRYTFHYRAATPDGVMSEEQTIHFVVHPPFWKTTWFIILSIAIISLLFFMVVKYITQRNLKEKLLRLEKEQSVEKERNRISRDMHDELGSGLTKIAILSEVVKTQPQHAISNIDKISETARNLVDNLDEMVWALNPRNDSLDKLLAYIAEYAHQFLENTGMNVVVQLPEQVAPVHIGEEKRRNIFMAVKEFLNNSVKHSGAKNISITATQTAGAFEITLRDDGRGTSPGQASELGNGLRNMRQRIEDVGGTATLQSQPGAGMQLHIHCPV